MISVEIHKSLPANYESWLVEKYESYITTCGYIEIYYPAQEINHMLIFEDKSLTDLIIFGNEGNTCICFNSLVTMPQEVIEIFAENVFDKYPTIQKIRLAGSYKGYNLKRSFLFSKSNDYILCLPTNTDAYYSQLGSTTRRHIKNYNARFMRDFPDAQYITAFKTDIKESVIDKIVQLSFNRMKSKGIIPGKSQQDTNDFYRYSQYYGCVAYIEINGQIVAGSISYILNNRIYLYMIAHDNNFAKYNVGQLCIVNLIKTSIDLKLSTFHFLWGDNEYKARLQAKPHALFTYVIYRAYSFSFIVSKIKAKTSRMLINIRQSKYSKPLREAIKSYRRKSTLYKPA